MTEDQQMKAAEAVLIGTLTGRDIQAVEQDLLALGLSRDEARGMLARGLAAKQTMGGALQEMRQRQMSHPPGSTPSDVQCFEVPIQTGDKFLCSDNSCPCSGQERLDPGTTGYLFISKEVVSMREDCLTWEECLEKLERVRKTHNAQMVIDVGVVGPIFMCAHGAGLKNLDLQVAASDAANWAKTGLCPLRPTSLVGGSASSGPSPGKSGCLLLVIVGALLAIGGACAVAALFY